MSFATPSPHRLLANETGLMRVPAGTEFRRVAC